MDRILRACLALVVMSTSMSGCEDEWAGPLPGSAFPELTSDGAWCWFGDPRAVRFQGSRDRVYAGWVDSEGSIVVSSLDLESGERARHTVQPDFNRDDHANPFDSFPRAELFNNPADQTVGLGNGEAVHQHVEGELEFLIVGTGRAVDLDLDRITSAHLATA